MSAIDELKDIVDSGEMSEEVASAILTIFYHTNHEIVVEPTDEEKEIIKKYKNGEYDDEEFITIEDYADELGIKLP